MNGRSKFCFAMATLSVLIGLPRLCAQNRDPLGRLDQGGTYCEVATVIPSNATSYTDTGLLDWNNDCSSPFPWPYNEVFYKITPSLTRLYTFRLSVAAPSTGVALRIKADACCAGGVSVAGTTAQVAADCDAPSTTYLRAALTAGTSYWIHAGDNSPAPSGSRYRFEMLCVDCPAPETVLPHSTWETAQDIALNDSLIGDSAFAGHPDWYRFFVTEQDSVFLSVVGREFGHCLSGFYPANSGNYLDAHFQVFCQWGGGLSLGEGQNELCSTDARVALCLPSGIYYVKVQNYGIGSWGTWPYILRLFARASNTDCALPTGCGECFPCACPPADTLVVLVPDPSGQPVHVCASLNFDISTRIIVPAPSGHPPVVAVSPSCPACEAQGCVPATAFIYDPQAWIYIPTQGCYSNWIRTAPAAMGCCACLTLEPPGPGRQSAPSGSAVQELPAVTAYALHQNYPNPANPTTAIAFDLLDNGFVSLKLYDVLGREAATLVQTGLSAGRHTVRFDASGLASGIYIYRLRAGHFVSDRKLLVLK
ncbi:MAG TPA: T9SS type A sorting domain-containing protein [bacterium]|jgi:hypothetical protein